MDATRKGPTPPLALPTRPYMEQALALWDKLGLPTLKPQTPWHGYSMGLWSDAWEEAAQRAIHGTWQENGVVSAGGRRAMSVQDHPCRRRTRRRRDDFPSSPLSKDRNAPIMKPSAFQYHRPDSVAKALQLLATHENARILAGGQSLMPMLNMRLAAFDHLVDINRIPELSQIAIEADLVRIGAMVRQVTLLDHPDLARRIPILREALTHVGHLPTCTRGTIGGSLAHLDPSAELPGIAALHDATVVVRSASRERRIELANFVVDYLTPDIAPDEMLVSVELPLWPPAHGWSFIEFAHRHGDFALVGVGVLLLADPHGEKIERAAIVITGVDKGRFDTEAESQLAGAPISEASWNAAADCTRLLEPPSDQLATRDYRKRLARTLTQRALQGAATRARAELRTSPT